MPDRIDSASPGEEQAPVKNKVMVLMCARCGKRYPLSSGLKSCPSCVNSDPSGCSKAATEAPTGEECGRRSTNDDEKDVSVLRLLGYFVSALFLLFLLQLGWAVWHMNFLLK